MFEGLEWITPSSLAIESSDLIILTFWRPLCCDSLQIQSFLNNLSSRYQGLGVDVVGVVTPLYECEKDLGVNLEYLSRHNIVYPVLMDIHGRLAARQDLARLPTTQIICSEEVIASYPGWFSEYNLEVLLRDSIRLKKTETLPSFDGFVSYFRDIVESHARGGFAVSPDIHFGASEDSLRKLSIEGEFDLTSDGLLLHAGSRFIVRFKSRTCFAAISPLFSQARVDVLLNGGFVRSHAIGADILKAPSGASYLDVTRPALYNLVGGGWGNRELSITTSGSILVHDLFFR